MEIAWLYEDRMAASYIIAPLERGSLEKKYFGHVVVASVGVPYGSTKYRYRIVETGGAKQVYHWYRQM